MLAVPRKVFLKNNITEHFLSSVIVFLTDVKVNNPLTYHVVISIIILIKAAETVDNSIKIHITLTTSDIVAFLFEISSSSNLLIIILLLLCCRMMM